MKRQVVLVTAVGTGEFGRPWCALNESFMRPGDKGWIGPFELVEVRYSSNGQLMHFLKPVADPYVGELLALTQTNSPTPSHEVMKLEKATTKRQKNHSQHSRLRLAT